MASICTAGFARGWLVHASLAMWCPHWLHQRNHQIFCMLVHHRRKKCVNKRITYIFMDIELQCSAGQNSRMKGWGWGASRQKLKDYMHFLWTQSCSTAQAKRVAWMCLGCGVPQHQVVLIAEHQRNHQIYCKLLIIGKYAACKWSTKAWQWHSTATT